MCLPQETGGQYGNHRSGFMLPTQMLYVVFNLRFDESELKTVTPYTCFHEKVKYQKVYENNFSSFLLIP
jgi:hypothetical protein